jgi:hypothetical protein
MHRIGAETRFLPEIDLGFLPFGPRNQRRLRFPLPAFHRHQAYGFMGLPIMTASVFLHDQLEIGYANEVPCL